jgi:hypothetical protein
MKLVISMETHKMYLEMSDMYSISYFANVNMIFKFCKCIPSTMAMACKIHFQRSQGDCGINGWYTWSSTYPHR